MNTKQNPLSKDFPENVQTILTEGNRLLKEKKFPEALVHFKNMLELPGFPQDIILSQIGLALFN